MSGNKLTMYLIRWLFGCHEFCCSSAEFFKNCDYKFVLNGGKHSVRGNSALACLLEKKPKEVFWSKD
jgi:hypothetical protein